MAEILTNNNRRNKKSCSKKSTRVDLTPMVDLGFLLITFFVFTTTMSEAKAMDMLVPNDKDSSSTSAVCESCALTVILGKNDELYYYEGGGTSPDFKTSNYSATGIRKIIVDKKRALTIKNPNWDVQLIIKPTEASTFKNLVDIIDEAVICTLKRYYIDEVPKK